MEKKRIKDLKIGEYFIPTKNESPTLYRVWVMDGLFSKDRYKTHQLTDVNHEVIRRGNKQVWVGFELLGLKLK